MNNQGVMCLYQKNENFTSLIIVWTEFQKPPKLWPAIVFTIQVAFLLSLSSNLSSKLCRLLGTYNSSCFEDEESESQRS